MTYPRSLALLWFGLLLFASGWVFAQTQTFSDGFVPQTIISTVKTASECAKFSTFAMYQGQYLYFYSTLQGETASTIRIINSATGQNGTFYEKGAPDSSKELIYNPFGALSDRNAFVGKNSFISNFTFVSHIKPAGIPNVYVSRQATPTYFVGSSFGKRNEIAGQIIHNNWRRAPYTIQNDIGSIYSYVPFDTKTQLTKQLYLGYGTGPGWDRTDNNEYLCNSIYVARCGDGIIDAPTGDNTTDGQGGIKSSYAGFLQWFTPTFKSELCDSGALNNDTTPGACKRDCSSFVPNNQTAPTCEITVPLSGIYLATTGIIDWTITGDYTNSPSLIVSPTTITGLPFVIPQKTGSREVNPTQTGTYTVSLALSNAGGSVSCTGDITVGYCGDGNLDETNDEVCDAGPDNGSDLCTTICTIPPIDSPVDEAVLQ